MNPRRTLLNELEQTGETGDFQYFHHGPADVFRCQDTVFLAHFHIGMAEGTQTGTGHVFQFLHVQNKAFELMRQIHEDLIHFTRIAGVDVADHLQFAFGSMLDEIHFHDMLSSCRRHFEYVGGSSWVLAKPFDDVLDVPLGFRVQDSVERWNNIEQQLRMIYASLTTTEVDSVEAAEQISNIQAATVVANNPIVQAQLRVHNLPAASTKRLMPPTKEEVGAYTVERFKELLKDYYSNFNGSVLVVQGEVDADTLKPLLLKYIGSLPSKPEPVKRRIWEADHFKLHMGERLPIYTGNTCPQPSADECSGQSPAQHIAHSA